VTAVFVPGPGSSGPQAWPVQTEDPALAGEPCVFTVGGAGALDELTEALEAAGGGHVVAHSAGAVPALQLTDRRPELVRTLVLLEPACFAAARGGPQVEAHIAHMTEAFATAGAPEVDDVAFAVTFLDRLGATPPDPDDPATAAFGHRVRSTPPPWELALDRTVVARVPTLVLTGGWNALYDEVADALEAAGAHRAVLSGHAHRPQDHPDADGLLLRHWAAA
jgi:pimeloyl-ACP methyl ester carboxylesterase